MVKNPPASAGDETDEGSIPGLGRPPGGGHGLRKKRLLWIFRGLVCFYTNCENFCSSSVKNTLGNLIGIALNQ